MALKSRMGKKARCYKKKRMASGLVITNRILMKSIVFLRV